MQKFGEIGQANNLNVQKDEILIIVFFIFIMNVVQLYLILTLHPLQSRKCYFLHF